MVELSTGLLTGLVGFGIGVVTTLVLVLLIVIYRNTVGCKDKKEDEEDNSFIIPMSQIAGAGAGGGYSLADIQRATAMMRAGAGTGAPAKPPEEPPAANTGTYL